MGTAGISWCPTAGVAVRGGAPPAGLQRLEEVVEVQLTAVVLVDLLRQTSGLARAEREGEGA